MSARRKVTTTVKLRKNGKRPVDARSTMDMPIGQTRIVQPRVVYQWLAPGLAAYTPSFIQMLLNGALAGDHISQYELFRLMLDTWPVLRSCQEELIYGVTRRNIVFDPYTEEDQKPAKSAIEREKLVTSVIANMNPDVTMGDNGLIGTIKDIMDAWFKGISVLEILWQNIDTPSESNVWGPRSTAWVHPFNYSFNSAGQIGLVLPYGPTGYGQTTALPVGYGLTSAPAMRGAPPAGYGSTTAPPARTGTALVPFPPDKFLICFHKGVSGNPFSSAMLRPLAWWWCASNFASDWLLNLAQIFGLPFRWATYAASAPEQTVSAICDMLANMGSAGWAAFPEGASLALKESSLAHSGHTPQGDILDKADSYARMLILGQTLTGQTIASGRGGQAFGTVEAQLKQDRLDAACAFVADVINGQLIPAILRQNYGDISDPPSVRFLQETVGTFQDAERDQILTAIGTTIPISHIRQKYAIPEPIGGEPVTHPPAPKPPGGGSPSAGPSGTSPISKTPAVPPLPKDSVEASIEVSDIGEFGKELRKLADELTTKETA